MGELLFVEEHEGVVVVDAVVGPEPVSATVALPGSQVLQTIVCERLRAWAEDSTPVTWELTRRGGGRLRLGDGRTTLTLDLAA